MRKAIAVFAAYIAFTLLAGCSDKGAVNAVLPEQEEVQTDEAVPADDEIQDNGRQPASLDTQEGIRAYLAGKWTLFDRDSGKDFGTLTISEDGSFEFVRLSDKAEGSGTLYFENVQTEEGERPDGFRMEFSDIGALVPADLEMYGNEGTSGIFHIGSFGDEDYLYLKEIGNGDSVVSMFAFNTDPDPDEIGGWKYDWLFYRPGDGENDAEAIKDESFYAWAWETDDKGDGVWLQPMNGHEFETYGDYSNQKFMGGFFTETEDIRIAYYDLPGGKIPDGIVSTSEWSSGYPLMMCSVTTDQNGDIKEIGEIDIAMYDVYDMGELDPEYSFEGTRFVINGVDIDMRETVAVTDAIVGCTRAGDWIVIECHINPQKSVYEFYNIPNGNMAYFEYEITGAQLTWQDDDLSTAVYLSENHVYDFWGHMIGYVDEGEITRIEITDDTTVTATVQLEDSIGRLKEYTKEFEYEPCDRAVLTYYEYMLGGARAWRRLKEQAGSAKALIIVNPPEAILDKMRSTVEYERGALDKVAVIPLLDDAEVTIGPSGYGTDTGQQVIRDGVGKGEACVYDVTVSEALPVSVISISSPDHAEAVWDVVQLSGRIPQMSTFIR